MKQKKQFTPQTLRSILATIFVLILIGGGAVFYFGIQSLQEYAVKVQQRLVDAEASERQISELQLIKGQLSESDSLVEKTNQIFATPDSYQGQVLNDLERYAKAAGLTLGGTNFGSGETATNTVTVSFSGDIPYRKLIAFLSNVEGNLPKLQVVSITLSQSDNASADTVRADEIKINVAVR
jgi:hypothetical protein